MAVLEKRQGGIGKGRKKMKKEERQKLLLEKLDSMQVYERALREQGIRLIAGVDEVGRGPLAGPVVAAAVILPEDFDVLGVDDSKKLSEKKREELYDKITEWAVCWAVGMADNRRIDEINILNATKEAMAEAIGALSQAPEHILIDALTLPQISIPQTGIIKGDAKSLSIAAASIVAKVTRDRMMTEWSKSYPAYAFDRNKGYGTKDHYAGIAESGICPIHRKTFLKNLHEKR